MILLLLGKEKPWTGLAINRKKAKAMAGVMMITPHSGRKAEVQRHRGLAETSTLWLLAPCWCSFPGVTEKKETMAGFLHAAEACSLFGSLWKDSGDKTSVGTICSWFSNT